MSDFPRYSANCSMLFRELPLLERPAAAGRLGFEAVEFWWPFSDPVPRDGEVDDFIDAVEGAGVRLTGLNFFAGDLAGPDCGVLSIPQRSSEFLDNVDVTVGIGQRLGVPIFNALYGNRVDGVSPGAQDELAAANLATAAAAAVKIGAKVVVEAVSGPKPYPLRRAADAVAVVRRLQEARVEGIGFLCDVYHLAANGDDPVKAIRVCADVIDHVQIADFPGRGEPGSGSLDIGECLSALAANGYSGWIGVEYTPTTTTQDSLGWMSRPAF